MNKIREFSNIILSVFRQFWKYRFRDIYMSFSTVLISSGLVVLSAGTLNLSAKFELFGIPISFTAGENNYSLVGITLIVFGLGIGIFRLINLGKQLTGILIIHRGMEGMDTSSILKALPKSYSKGKLDIVDLHEGHQLYEGKVVHPERALDVINGLDQQIKSRLNGRNNSVVKLSYAGIAPIPLLVTAGYKITSRQECLTLDYSRSNSWHGLDNLDDMEEISISEPDAEIHEKVAVVMPFSVEISMAQIPNKLKGQVYFIRLKDGVRPDSLNSSDKQVRIASEFYKFCANLKAKHPDIKEIHLFVACQASFAFRLGSMLTTSVMQRINIYQYDSEIGGYSWGVSIAAGSKPSIVNME